MIMPFNDCSCLIFSRVNSEYDSENRPVVLRGYRLLWQPEVIQIYLPLLSDCSNPETLEAAAGAIQNLAACEWEVKSGIVGGNFFTH